MARTDKRFTVYPAQQAISVLGGSTPALNLAIECWASVIARATAENSKVFTSDDEWGILIAVLNSFRIAPECSNPGELMATAIEEANQLRGVGKEFRFVDGAATLPYAEWVSQRLRELDYARAWALITTIEWYIENYTKITDAGWWTLTYRIKWNERRALPKGRKSAGKNGSKKTKQKS